MHHSEVRLGVGAYDNNEWQLVKIGRWMEYACGVKSETVKLDRRVPLRSAWTSFLSKVMLSCILRVSLEYASHILRYDTLIRYRIDSPSIPEWLDIQSWINVRRVRKLTVILLCNWQKISQYGWFVEYPEVVYGCRIRCPSNRHASKKLNQTWRFRHTWKYSSRLQISLSTFHKDNIQ
jgi:hypothetical protein